MLTKMWKTAFVDYTFNNNIVIIDGPGWLAYCDHQWCYGINHFHTVAFHRNMFRYRCLLLPFQFHFGLLGGRFGNVIEDEVIILVLSFFVQASSLQSSIPLPTHRLRLIIIGIIDDNDILFIDLRKIRSAHFSFLLSLLSSPQKSTDVTKSSFQIGFLRRIIIGSKVNDGIRGRLLPRHRLILFVETQNETGLLQKD
jgi:hypothetical protein